MRVGALSITMLLVGCASTTPTTPVEVVRAQVDALNQGDEGAAFELLSADAQALSPHWPTPDALPVQGHLVETRREVTWNSGTSVVLGLLREATGWQIHTGVLGLLKATTPNEALATFSRAILAEDWATLFELLPDQSRADWTPAALSKAFEDAASKQAWVALAQVLRTTPQELTALAVDRSEAAVGETRIVLIREDNAWKVFDVQPAKLYTVP